MRRRLNRLRRRLNRLAFYLGTSLGRRRLRIRFIRLTRPILLRLAYVWRRTVARRVRVVGVTGTFGKTSTSRAAAAALGCPIHRDMALNTISFVALAVLRLRPWRRNAVIEISITGPGQMEGQVARAKPDVAVVTAIGSEHITSFGSLDVTAAEKGKIVRALPPDGLAILNGDDPRVAAMASFAPCRVVTYGMNPGNDIRAEDIRVDWPRGTRFDLVMPDGRRREGRTRLLGAPGVYAALAGVAAGVEAGIELDAILERLAQLRPRPGRLELMSLPNGAYVIRDDCKGAVESFDVALDTLTQIAARKRIVLFGEFSEGTGDDRPRDVMRRLGGRAGRIADTLIFFGSKRSGQAYRAGARRAGLPDERNHYVGSSIPACVSLLRGILGEGDVLLIKGRNEARLGRVALALMGRTVRCSLRSCNLVYIRCESCDMLTRGWIGFEAVAGRHLPDEDSAGAETAPA